MLGRFLAERQVEFAWELGCDRVIVIGGGGAEAIAVRHRSEELGLQYREISGPHALAISVEEDGHLLILDERLMAFSDKLPDNSLTKPKITTLSAELGQDAGFERIDLTRAWGGAMLVEGRHLQGLINLPEDSEAAPAILRLALQAGVPEIRLADALLADGDWGLLRSEADLKSAQSKLLDSRINNDSAKPIGQRLVDGLLKKLGARLVSNAQWPLGIAFAGILALSGALALAWIGMTAVGFLLLSVGAILIELSRKVKELGSLPQAASKIWRLLPGLTYLALLTCGIMAIDGVWYRMAFPPLMLVSLLLLPLEEAPKLVRILSDKALAALTIGLIAFLTNIEAAIMLVGLFLLVLRMPWRNLLQS